MILSSHLVFELEGASYALPLDALIEVARRVRVTPLPEAPAVILGLVVHRGEPTPVVDLRARFGLSRAAQLSDQMIVARTKRRTLALIVDRIEGVRELDPGAVKPAAVEDPHVAGVTVVDGSVLLVHDLEALLSLDDERALRSAMERR